MDEDNENEDDDMWEDEQDDHLEGSDNVNDEDSDQEENTEQDIENHEDFATDLLESRSSINDQPEDTHSEENRHPTISLSREENDPESDVSAQRKENSPHSWTGFKMAGDNVDKNIRPSFQRIDRQTKSLHYFHACAAKDRIDFSLLSDTTPTEVVIDLRSLLPDDNDVAAIKKDFVVLSNRYLIL